LSSLALSAPAERPQIALLFDGGESYGPKELRRAVRGLESTVEITLLGNAKGADGSPGALAELAPDLLIVDGVTDGLSVPEDDLARIRDAGGKVAFILSLIHISEPTRPY